jgi:phosphatidylserine/phosphatidylglycerophosphate/cardiolipin synthase-like enzyme
VRYCYDIAIVGSANFTNNAFNRNMEMGVIIKGPGAVAQASEHFETLAQDGMLLALKHGTTTQSNRARFFAYAVRGNVDRARTQRMSRTQTLLRNRPSGAMVTLGRCKTGPEIFGIQFRDRPSLKVEGNGA